MFNIFLAKKYKNNKRLMIRIGFDAKRAFNNLRGLGSYSRNLIEGLTTLYPDNEYYLLGNKPKEPSCIHWLQNLEGKAKVISPKNGSGIGKALWRSAGMIKDIRHEKLDLYHGLSHEIPYFTSTVKSKFVVTIHDLIFLYYKDNFSIFDREIYLSKIKRSCHKSDKIIAISEQTKSDLINLLGIGSEKIEVIYQSCSPMFYERASEEKNKEVRNKLDLPDEYLLFVGALVEHKNVINIIDSISILPEEFKIPLIIVGKGKEYKEELIKRVKIKGLSEKVKFIDYVDNEDMPSLNQKAKLLIWPSLYEGFGIPIIESLFSGVPVLTSNLGVFREAAGKGGIYVNPASIEEISDSIINILSDEELYKKLQKEGYQYVQKFHIKNTTTKLMDLYQSVL